MRKNTTNTHDHDELDVQVVSGLTRIGRVFSDLARIISTDILDDNDDLEWEKVNTHVRVRLAHALPDAQIMYLRDFIDNLDELLGDDANPEAFRSWALQIRTTVTGRLKSAYNDYTRIGPKHDIPVTNFAIDQNDPLEILEVITSRDSLAETPKSIYDRMIENEVSETPIQKRLPLLTRVIRKLKSMFSPSQSLAQ